MTSELLASKTKIIDSKEDESSCGGITKMPELKQSEVSTSTGLNVTLAKDLEIITKNKRKLDDADDTSSKLQKNAQVVTSSTFVKIKSVGADYDGVHEAEKEVLELADVAASSAPTFSQTDSANKVVVIGQDPDVGQDATATMLNNLTNIADCTTSGPVEIVVEQDVPIKSEEKSFPRNTEVSDTTVGAATEPVQTNTATVAAPQGVNPAMMSNLLHTAAAVAATQNVAAATVQVIPGHSAGTIQLVPASDVQRTQELMAAGLPPQNVNQSPEELAKITQPVFSYLVTSQGTLIAAHASDGTELISSSSNDSDKTPKRSGRGRRPKNSKPTVKKTEPLSDGSMTDCSMCVLSHPQFFSKL